MPMKGAKAHIRRLKALSGPRMSDAIGKALFAGGELIQTEAQISITRGAVSGKNHTPSPPGTPPNADTHHLSDNIETTQPSNELVEVRSNASYSARHEFGPEGRKFMRPARDKKKREVRRLVEMAANRTVKSSRSTD